MRVSVSASCFRGGCGSTFSGSDSSFYLMFFQDCFQNLIATCHESEEEETKVSCVTALCKYVVTSSSNSMERNGTYFRNGWQFLLGIRELYAVLLLVS